MSVLQHYYTSFVNKENGSAGFQVKAMSPGIPSDVQATISRLIAYRIPPTLDEHRISTHPVALRYYYEGQDRCILLCSQSNGTDENGRPGNFFAHTLVMEPDKFKHVPPILYWRSPFWRARDTGTSAIIDPLPGFEVEPVLDIEGVWDFLAQGKRVTYFHKLMSAVVHYNTSRRRIVIIDTADNVAMWIAAVSCMLPPDYRPMLSFATYHHDPYQAQFIITGTTSDSSFRASSEEYMSFFILNAEADRISSVDDSPYADEAAEAARSTDAYEIRLLSLFTDYVQRFPPPKCIDEQLDQMVRYARLFEPQHQKTLTSDDLKAINTVISTFERSSNFTREDLRELHGIGMILYNAYETQTEDENAIYTEYYRIVALQKKHKIPTDEAALIALTDFTKRLIREANPEQVLPRLGNLRQIYGEEMFLTTINRTEYLQWLKQILERINVEQLARVWKYLGPYMRFDQQRQGFLLTSLCMLGDLWNEKQSKEGTALFDSIAQAIGGREQELLRFAVNNYDALPESTLQRFYCKLVHPLDLDKRVPYRTTVQRVDGDIGEYELNYEIVKAGMQNGLKAFEQWIEHARQQRLGPIATLIDVGLASLRSIYARTPQQWYDLAPRILTSKVLEPLPQDWEDHLVDTALSKVSLSRFSSTDIKMCKKYQDRPGLSEETWTVVHGLLAMSSGQLDQDLTERLRKRFKTLSADEYQEEAKSFISEFLNTCATKEAHHLMIDMIFITWKEVDCFWQPYWETFTKMLTNPSSAGQAVELLSYWFTASPDSFRMVYTLQFFFLNLSQNLEEARSARGFRDAVRQVSDRVEKQRLAWYPLVQGYFSGRKNVVVSVGQNLAVKLQKRLINQNVDEKEVRARTEQEQKEREFVASVAAIFEDKKIRQSHAQTIVKIYKWSQREQFWTCYWENFTGFLISQDADKTLELLTFWFDESFQVLEHMPYVPQEFFLGLSEALEAARKDRNFREKARQINVKGEKYRQELYRWYGLVQEYFVEQEKGRLGFFRRN